ncbi:MAG: PIN domain nuclease [Gemmatimonadetes bacterium]|nr:PIN domain nuclease [Gemmatimonadota bacterium]
MKTVDSCGWIEFFTGGPLAGEYERYITMPDSLITPTLVLFEVYRLIKRERGEEDALIAAAQIAQTALVPLSESLALSAADIGLERGLAMADSVVYATALSHQAELVTSGTDFEGLPGVRLLERV